MGCGASKAPAEAPAKYEAPPERKAPPPAEAKQEAAPAKTMPAAVPKTPAPPVMPAAATEPVYRSMGGPSPVSVSPTSILAPSAGGFTPAPPEDGSVSVTLEVDDGYANVTITIVFG